MRVALDTNILAYAEGVNGTRRRGVALDLVHKLPQEATVIPVQVLGELFNVLVRKAGKPRRDAREALLSWRDTFSVVETSSEIMLAAADLATDHQLESGTRLSCPRHRKRAAACCCRKTFRRVSPAVA